MHGEDPVDVVLRHAAEELDGAPPFLGPTHPPKPTRQTLNPIHVVGLGVVCMALVGSLIWALTLSTEDAAVIIDWVRANLP